MTVITWFGKNMHGQKTQMVFYQKNYNYVQVCPTRKDGTSPLQPGDIWVDSDEIPYQQSMYGKTENGLSVIMQTNHQRMVLYLVTTHMTSI